MNEWMKWINILSIAASSELFVRIILRVFSLEIPPGFKWTIFLSVNI
jgi:hypothetical protein